MRKHGHSLRRSEQPNKTAHLSPFAIRGRVPLAHAHRCRHHPNYRIQHPADTRVPDTCRPHQPRKGQTDTMRASLSSTRGDRRAAASIIRRWATRTFGGVRRNSVGGAGMRNRDVSRAELPVMYSACHLLRRAFTSYAFQCHDSNRCYHHDRQTVGGPRNVVHCVNPSLPQCHGRFRFASWMQSCSSWSFLSRCTEHIAPHPHYYLPMLSSLKYDGIRVEQRAVPDRCFTAHGGNACRRSAWSATIWNTYRDTNGYFHAAFVKRRWAMPKSRKLIPRDLLRVGRQHPDFAVMRLEADCLAATGADSRMMQQYMADGDPWGADTRCSFFAGITPDDAQREQAYLLVVVARCTVFEAGVPPTRTLASDHAIVSCPRWRATPLLRNLHRVVTAQITPLQQRQSLCRDCSWRVA